MLRLKHVSINPAHIDSVDISDKKVIIGMAVPDVQPTVVMLKTEADAIYFSEYVELLVDVINERKTDSQEAVIENFESYFTNYLRPREIQETVHHKVLECLNNNQRAK